MFIQRKKNVNAFVGSEARKTLLWTRLATDYAPSKSVQLEMDQTRFKRRQNCQDRRALDRSPTPARNDLGVPPEKP